MYLYKYGCFNFTDLHGTCRCRFVFMQRGFTVVCIPWIQAAEVPFNNHTAVMPVTLLLHFIVMSPASPIILVRAGYLYFSLPLFAAAHCNSSLHWTGGGGKWDLIYFKYCNLLDIKNKFNFQLIFLCPRWYRACNCAFVTE